ncbi:MAG: hypothetical protein HN403_05060 [Rhodospirillales bacterium]|jgi:hypothetical protein|nr:hypothetical protein [Rhodospirillales bacterium]
MNKSFLRAAAAALFTLGLGLSMLAAGSAQAQSHMSNTDCEIESRKCERRVEAQNPGTDPCSAYQRCQEGKMCGADRCICLRTHGSADPALAQEAAAMCFGIISPHGPNTCDRYVEACQAWFNTQHQQTHPPQPQPSNPATPPGVAQPLPPDQTPRFR